MIEICQIQIKKYKAYTEIQMTNCSLPDSADDSILSSTNTEIQLQKYRNINDKLQFDSSDDTEVQIQKY